MNFTAFGLVLYFVLLLQSAVVPRIELFGARPDLLLCLAVFLGLYARRPEAIAGAWILGLCADLLTIERFGLLAGSYGLLVIAVVSIREFLFRYRSTTQFTVTFVSAIALQIVWRIYARTVYGVDSLGITTVLLSAFYSGLFAVPIHRAMLRIPRFMGIPRPRHGLSGV